MCIVSGVFDQARQTIPTWPQPTPVTPVADLLTLRILIDEFRDLVDAAKRIDRFLGNPDCEDPEKAKLEERVTELERQLTKILRRSK